MNKKLRRSRTGRLLSGVCSGLADFFGLNVSLIRIVFVFAIPIYFLLWIIIPEEKNRYFND